jgi:hypothetical protein
VSTLPSTGSLAGRSGKTRVGCDQRALPNRTAVSAGRELILMATGYTRRVRRAVVSRPFAYYGKTMFVQRRAFL